MSFARSCAFLTAIVAWTIAVGCNTSTQSKVVAPEVAPAAAADAALATYDKNSDGSLDATEIEACPAIRSSLERYDANGDKSVSRQELVDRFAALFSAGVGLVNVDCTIVRAGRPLPGVSVRFIPEPFFGEALQEAVGETSIEGKASMAIPDEKLPENQRGLRMMQIGVYKVEVSGPGADKIKHPLGCDIDMTSRTGLTPAFDLAR